MKNKRFLKIFFLYFFLLCFFSFPKPKFIDISNYCNMGFVDEIEEDQKGGWTDQGKYNSLDNFPVGIVKFAGIDFKIINPQENNGKSCIVLKGIPRPYFPEKVEVKVSEKTKYIYFLHTIAWGAKTEILGPYPVVAKYIINYDDGTIEEINIRQGKEINGWWFPQDTELFKVGWIGKNPQCNKIGVGVYRWENPYPEKEIKSIVLKSENTDAVPIILGITIDDEKKELISVLTKKDTQMQDIYTYLPIEKWFKVEMPIDDFSPNVLDKIRKWHKPAGIHGYLKRNENGNFVFEDGTPAKFWGVVGPLCPSKSDAEYLAKRLSKYGFNLIRMHNLRSELTDWYQADNTKELNKNKLDRLDYFISQLKKEGIYVQFVMWYGNKFKEKDGIKDWNKDFGLLSQTLYFDKPTQDFYLEFLKKIFTHRNPYTGLTYAEDPVIVQVQIVNENNMFFNSLQGLPPSYLIDLKHLFIKWVKDKYKTDENLFSNWKTILTPFETGESIDDMMLLSIFDLANPIERKIKRAKDQALFYYQLQTDFYKKVEKTLRDLGYKGMICGTPWYAPGWLNEVDLYSNAELDFISKHTYWDHGRGGWRPEVVTFDNKPMIKYPEKSMILPGYNRVFSKPFMITEWNCVYPNEFVLESVPIMASYAALQGWSGLTHFAIGDVDWTGYLNEMFGIATNPMYWCLEPIGSLIFLRGDVKEGDIVYKRKMSFEDIFNPKREIERKVLEKLEDVDYMRARWEDLKFPSYIFGVGKVGIEFVEKKQENFIDQEKIRKYIDEKNKIIKSSTEELTWNYGQGYLVVDTERTQGAVGFLDKLDINTKYLKINLENPFCAVFLSSVDEKAINFSSHLLLTIVGRCRNKGQEYVKIGNEWQLKSLGTSPVLMEPVNLNLEIKNNKNFELYALDINGKRIRKIQDLISKDGKINLVLNTGNEKSIYYELIERR
ncbi:MAG: hypothetical protein ACK4F0_08385 [Candidatus Ratteibacteria bacterium]